MLLGRHLPVGRGIHFCVFRDSSQILKLLGRTSLAVEKDLLWLILVTEAVLLCGLQPHKMQSWVSAASSYVFKEELLLCCLSDLVGDSNILVSSTVPLSSAAHFTLILVCASFFFSCFILPMLGPGLQPQLSQALLS